MDQREREYRFKIRFNFQAWLKEDIGEFDHARIGGALGIDPVFVKQCVAELRDIVSEQAARLDQDKKYSSQIDGRRNDTVIFIGDSITSDRLSPMRSDAKAVRLSPSSSATPITMADAPSATTLRPKLDSIHIAYTTNRMSLAAAMRNVKARASRTIGL